MSGQHSACHIIVRNRLESYCQPFIFQLLVNTKSSYQSMVTGRRKSFFTFSFYTPFFSYLLTPSLPPLFVEWGTFQISLVLVPWPEQKLSSKHCQSPVRIQMARRTVICKLSSAQYAKYHFATEWATQRKNVSFIK